MGLMQYKNVDEYISGFPKHIQDILKNLRKVIKETAPEAQETISYGMPAYKQNGPLVYFAGQKNHIGFYPTSSPVEFFKKELEPYQVSKGTIRFPLDKPVPYTLIKMIVKFKIAENSKNVRK